LPLEFTLIAQLLRIPQCRFGPSTARPSEKCDFRGRRAQFEKEQEMTGARVLVGTRKGAFVLTSDGKPEKWDVSGPHFGGWEIYHLKGSPADPNRIYASQSSGWFGQVIQRSDDGGKTWEPVGNKFVYDDDPGTHKWYDGTPQRFGALSARRQVARLPQQDGRK
jgi:hypothetical protein